MNVAASIAQIQGVKLSDFALADLTNPIAAYVVAAGTCGVVNYATFISE